MGHSLFISDLHLCASRPHITKTFITFLKNTASKAESLYILGDFFEYWPGDDAIAIGLHKETITALSQLSDAKTNVFFMHGNRDFLIGKDFCKASNIKLLHDPKLLTLYGKQVLLSHGDALCIDDVSYQEFREMVRGKAWQAAFLSQPLNKRIADIEALRKKSEQEKSNKTLDIMDVNKDAVENLLEANGYPPIFIHGHTHRPKKHIHQVDSHETERWVLGDWYDHGSYLMMDNDGCRSIDLQIE